VLLSGGDNIVIALALILTFSPGEKEQPLRISGLRMDVRHIHAHGFP